jgi:hypothetical protein
LQVRVLTHIKKRDDCFGDFLVRLAAARADGRGQHINWPCVEMLSRFGGIRIEDDLAVTRSGHEKVTSVAFDSLQ